MKENKNLLLSYLIFFYSLAIAVALAYLILSLLNFKPVPIGNLDNILPYYRPAFASPTYQIINYALAVSLITGFTVFQYLLFNKIACRYSRNTPHLLPPLAIISTVLLLLSFVVISNKGIHSLDQYKYVFVLDPVVYSNSTILISILGLLLLSYLYFSPIVVISIASHKFLKKLISFTPILAVILIVVTLFDRTFYEKHLFIGNIVQYEHTVPIIASIHDVINGKVILVDAYSQYGILLVYFLTLIFKFFLPLTFSNFFYLMIVLGILYYIIAYILLSIRLKSVFWALIGLFSLFTFHFYPTFDRYSRPMVFPLRYILDLPFFLLLLKADMTKKFWSCLILPAYLSMAFFFNGESGFSLIVGYAVYIFLKIAAGKSPNLLAKFFRFIFHLIPIAVWIFVFGLGYSFYAKIKTGYFPDWLNAFFYLRIYSKYLTGDAPPVIGLHLLPLSVYLIVLIKSLIMFVQRVSKSHHFWDVSMAVYGLTILIYFIKSSYILYLAVLSVPAIILAVVLFKELFETAIINRNYPLSSFTAFTLFIPYIVFGALYAFSFSFFVNRLGVNRFHSYWGNDYLKADSVMIYDKLVLSSTVLNKYEKDKKSVVLFSYYDGFIKLKANKVNALKLTSSLHDTFTVSQVNSLFSAVKKLNPRYIYTDTDEIAPQFTPGFYHYKIFPLIYDYIYQNYHKIETAGFLDVWERNAI